MNTPNPDPGEEYPHVNTQLFGHHRSARQPGRAWPSRWSRRTTRRPTRGRRPTMDGFVADYISAFTAEMGRQPTYDEYSQIMTGYTPEQMPVLSTLARGFATFDHWFCEVPSQTFTNRSFFHAATASGSSSTPLRELPGAQHRRDHLRSARRARPDLAGLLRPALALLADRAHPRPPAARAVRDELLHDRPVLRRTPRNGELPTYAFIEPQIIGHGHNDMHPAVQRAVPRPRLRPAVLAARRRGLLARIYNAIRSSSSTDRLELPQHAAHGHLRRARRHLRPRPAARRALRPTRPPRRARWASPSTDSASACRRSRSRRGSPNRPSSTTRTATRR